MNETKWIDQRPALILVDVQRGFEEVEHWGANRNNPDAEEVCGRLLGLWREAKLPVIHVRHSSLDPNSKLHETHPGFAFSPHVLPIDGEGIITKHVNSAFIGTDLQDILSSEEIDTLVIVGLTTNHCVSTTVRMSGNLGYNTYVVSDATATFDREGHDGVRYDAQLVHDVTLAGLHGEFAEVVDSQKLIALLRS